MNINITINHLSGYVVGMFITMITIIAVYEGCSGAGWGLFR